MMVRYTRGNSITTKKATVALRSIPMAICILENSSIIKNITLVSSIGLTFLVETQNQMSLWSTMKDSGGVVCLMEKVPIKKLTGICLMEGLKMD
jgi:hypothetical protein